jgi:hypothetical protein
MARAKANLEVIFIGNYIIQELRECYAVGKLKRRILLRQSEVPN